MRTTLPAYSIAVVFSGVHEIKPYFDYYRCNTSHQYADLGSGHVLDWTAMGHGVVNCPGSHGYVAPPSGSEAARANSLYC